MPWAPHSAGDMVCMPRSLLVFNKRHWRWSPWATVVMWCQWVGVTDDGGG